MTSTLASPAVAAADRPRKVALSYLPGLDGLRAISVTAVLLYHARDTGIPWLPKGGFLGVEVFFVISGYLITALLLAEFRNKTVATGEGKIDFKQFWFRRARRLLPALYLLLITVSLYWFLFIREEMFKIRGDVVAALTYVTNWYLIFSKQSYFEAAGRDSPFKHLWSLAVEEQFYLVWPLILFGLLVVFHNKTSRIVMAILAMAAASALLMAVLYTPDTDPSRVYYGTDTRASGLLIGAALAFLWAPWRLTKRTGPGARWVLDCAGTLAVIGLFWFFFRSDEFDPFLYRGGFVVLSLTTAVVIAVVAHPVSLLGRRVLGVGVLTWIGERSYGIYLWHWPIFVITRPGFDVGITGYPLLFVRFALTIVIAEFSYRFVEMPIRRGAIGRWLARYRASKYEVRVALARKAALAGSVGAVLAVLVVGGFAAARPAATPTGFDPSSALAATTVPPRSTTHPATTAHTAAPRARSTPVSAATGTTKPTQATVVGPSYSGVLAIGDSVMLGAKSALEKRMPGILVDAMVNRQVKAGALLAAQLLAAGRIGRCVIIHLGTNGITSQAQYDKLMTTLSHVPKVVLLNTKDPRDWQDRVNGYIAATAKKYPNIVFLNWNAVGNAHHEYFWNDGIHLRPAGAAAFADLIAQAVG